MIDKIALAVLTTSFSLLMAETVTPPPAILTPAPATAPATVPIQPAAVPTSAAKPAPVVTPVPVQPAVPAEKQAKEEVPAMKIMSSAFEPNKPIPSKHTCEGGDVSPALSFDVIPTDAKSLALVVDDPDAPSGNFVHWVAWNIPPTKQGLGEGALVLNQGLNSFGETRYRGPCPPRGKAHHYHFKVYALDTMLNLPYGIHKADLEKAMVSHVLAEGELIGTYQRH